MTPISENRTFDTIVKRYDELDPVLGGITGESNEPIISLTNRTRFLYDYKSSFTGIQPITSSAAITVADIRKLNLINAAGNIVLTLDPVASFLPGYTLHFKCKNTIGKCVSIVPSGSEQIKDGSLVKDIWLYDGEEIKLVATDDHFEVLNAKGNFELVGSDAMARIQPRNSLIANGNNPETGGILYSRADYARLWKEVSASAIDDSTWLSDLVIYRGFFSNGNGTTTFRVPDMRSMQWRGLDASRGLDFARYGSNSGSYEPDSQAAHTHGLPMGSGTVSGAAGYIPDFSPADGNARVRTGVVDTTGGAETVGKNIGLIPVIYF